MRPRGRGAWDQVRARLSIDSLDRAASLCVTGGARASAWPSRRRFAASARIVIADRNVDLGGAAATIARGRVPGAGRDRAASVRAAHAAIIVANGRVDVLVNNAGIVRNTPAEDTSDEEWRVVMAVNCDGVFWCSRGFGRGMLAAGSRLDRQHRLDVRAWWSIKPQPQAAYNVSKAAVIQLTPALAAEWAARGVRVNAVAPGYVATEMTLRGMRDPVWKEEWIRSTPMGRIGQPEEIAPAVVYLASDASSYVTGSTLVIDGGYTAW